MLARMSIVTPSILEWVPAADAVPETVAATIDALKLSSAEVEWLMSCDVERLFKALGPEPCPRKEQFFACECVRRVHHLLDDPAPLAAIDVAERFAHGEASNEELRIAGEAARRAAQAARKIAEGAWSLGWDVPRVKAAWMRVWAASAAENACGANTRVVTEESVPEGGKGLRTALVAAWAHMMSTQAVADEVADEPLTDTGMFFSFLRELKRTTEDIQQARDRADPSCEAVQQAHLLREIFGNPFRSAPFDPSWRTPLINATAATIYQERDWGAMPMLGDLLEQAGCPNGSPLLRHCHGPCTHVRGCWVLDLVLGRE